MRVLVDTSVWADFLNGHPSTEAAMAEEEGCDVLARDRDMETILASGLLRAKPWPSAR